MIKKVVLNLLKARGYELRKVEKRRPIDSMVNMRESLCRIRELGINPQTIVDIGAAKGSWTNAALDVFPNADYILVEPLQEQIKSIPENLKKNKKISIVNGVVGAEQGKVNFTISEDLDGSGIYGNGGNLREVSMRTLDYLLSESKKAFLLKLDTHGFEIPIFKGAKKTLRNTEVIIVEVYGFHVSPTGKLFHEISAYLDEQGFRLFDIIDIMRRPKDEAFWQADVIYLKVSHPVFQDNNYR